MFYMAYTKVNGAVVVKLRSASARESDFKILCQSFLCDVQATVRYVCIYNSMYVI